MLEQTLVIFGLIAGFWFWSAHRRAGELAQRFAQEVCRRAGVQWLDQSASLHRLRLRRATEPGQFGLRIVWCYRFEYSTTGSNRKSTQLAVSGQRLLWVIEPEPESEISATDTLL